MIPLFKPYVSKESKENVQRVLNSGWIGMGPEVEAFEKEFAEYIGCANAVATNSATEALRIALHLRPGWLKSCVLTTPNTFVATNHVILQEGLIPHFVDIDPSTGAMDLDKLEDELKYHVSSVAAIMAVHYAGNPMDLDRLEELAQKYHTYLIQDSAHACGAESYGHRIGAIGTNCFSFHAVKNLCTGDGGMFTTNDDATAERARRLRWFGISASTAERSAGNYKWEYDVESVGWKSHMNDITAAIGRGQLKLLDEGNKRRRRLADLYKAGLSKAGIKTVDPIPDTVSSRHLLVAIFPDEASKIEAIKRLDKEEIGYGYHYKPNYLYKPYIPYKFGKTYPGMEEFYRTALSLPMHLFLLDYEVEKVCEVITK